MNTLSLDAMKEGRLYLWLIRAQNKDIELLPVYFAAYTSCSAVVIVRYGNGKLIRVSRSDLKEWSSVGVTNNTR
jgi:hypothetical protein